ncbi:hypothetical protein KGA66_25845 [Actinocrinis puniceicyclus]|uniref:Integral membrane protein n=1 Tax=Actinocrinis puniceicyclus TaxID=977794 RepID=A0A8J8BFB7_9ACTN|nr:hypothetical protein [Actinocrinis puniceicyclus]MBS2966490.1 hypothetical protein [Actinocrinis puniceicyclus]
MSVLFAAPEPGVDDDALLSRTETWFVGRGLPYFIEDHKATDDVFTRALALLAAYFVISLMLVLSLRLTVPQRIGGAALGIGLLLGLYTLRNLASGRGAFRRPRRIGWAEVGALVLIPPVVDAVVRKDWRINGFDSWKITGIDLGGNLGVVLGIYLFTSALLPLARWAVKRTFRELGEVFDLAARALPLLFLFNSFLFISKDVWEFAGEMTRHRLWGVVGLFALFTVLFLGYRLPAEVSRVAEHDDRSSIRRACQGTPMAGVVDRVVLHDGALALSRRQRANVLMVLFFGQMLQVLLLAVLVFVFFIGFGWVTMDSRHIAEWTGRPAEPALAFGHRLSDYLGFDLNTELFQVSIFLAAVSGFFFAVSSMTDEAYKEQFYARMNAELETAIQVRRVYVALYQGRHTAAAPDEDPAATHARLRIPRPTRGGRRWFEQTPYELGIRGLGEGEETVEHQAAEIEG